MSPTWEPLSKRGIVVLRSNKERRDLERKILSVAFKLSFEKGDTDGAALAHKGLCSILQSQLYDDGDGTSSSVIPASVWRSADQRSQPARTEESAQEADETEELAQIAETAEAPEAASQPVAADPAVAHSEEPKTMAVSVEPEFEPVSSSSAPSISVEPPSEPLEPAAICVEPPSEPTEVLSVDLRCEPSEDSSVSVTPPAEAAAPIEESLPDSKENEPAPPPEKIPVTAAELAGNFILDPKEVEEAFSLIGTLPPLDTGAFADFGNDVIATLGYRTSTMVLEGPGQGTMGGEITAALERLTAAMPASAIVESRTEPGTHAESAPGTAPGEARLQPAQEVLAQPVIETPLFEAPRPQLEDLPPAPPAIPEPSVTNDLPADAGEAEAAQLPVDQPVVDLLIPPPPAEFAGEAPVPAEEPGAGPLSYLDFGDGDDSSAPAAVAQPAQAEEPSDELTVSPEQVAALFAEAEGEPEPLTLSPEQIAALFAEAEAQPQPLGAVPLPVVMTPSQLIKTQSFYQILGVNKLSSYEEIHLKFWRLVRRMLQTRYASNMPAQNIREFREVLRHICVAHDILRDPVTRTDYDLRQLGMRQEPAAPEPGTEAAGPRRLMIGELLEIANVLDRTELQIALDMHKAEPGTMFGTFLVKAGFLNPEQLDSALLGQRLISSGKITVAQFQSAMFRMREHGTPFFDTLVAEGWLTPADMLGDSGGLWNQGQAPGAPAAAPSAAPGQDQDKENGTAAEVDAPPPENGSNGHHSEEHAAVVAAAKRAEMELLKSLESGDDSQDS